ncbi:MAG: hypothetical protein JJE09_13165 [Bacteroidia bacterium]|nr:hypothetical protein [Bacteroidia bacterium]
MQKIFETYALDPVYYHLNLVFEFLKLEYYNHYKVYRQAEKYFEEVNDAAANLLTNYNSFTFSAQFLLSKLSRYLRHGTEKELYLENESMFIDFEADLLDVPRHTVYVSYRALSCYYVDKYSEAAKWFNQLLNDVSLKKYPLAQMEIKAMLALQYCMLHDFELFNQLSNSIQRQIRMLETENCENILVFLKILKIAVSEAKKDKPKKISSLISKFKELEVPYFAPTMLLNMDETFIDNLTNLEI